MQIHSYLFSIMHLHQYGAFTKLLNKNNKRRQKNRKEILNVKTEINMSKCYSLKRCVSW